MSSEDIPAEKGQLRFSRLVLPGLLLAVAATSSHLASVYIDIRFPQRPVPPDLLFEVLPYIDAGQYVADAAVFAAIALVSYYSFSRARENVGRAMSVYALMYLLRSAMIVLTPLAPAHGEGATFGFAPYVQNGMWPSGHTAAALLAFLLIDAEKAPLLKKVALGLAVTECVSLILARGHYSIDIVGGLLLSYFVYHEWTQGRLFNALKRLIEQPNRI